MTRLYIIIMTLLFSVSSFGQIEERINHVLLKKDFQKLKKFVKTYQVEKDQVQITFGNIRDIAPGFQEAIFYISKSYPMNEGVSITCNPRLHILTQGNLIVYFYLQSREMKNFPKSFEATSDTTYSYSDELKLNLLKEQFNKTFEVSLNEKDLFIDTIYYGQNCGHGGEVPFGQKLINSWVSTSDTLNLLKWLQSPNTEKQIYAIQGLSTLALKGRHTPAQLKKIITYILDKKGTVNTCMVCDARHEELSDLIKQFNF